MESRRFFFVAHFCFNKKNRGWNGVVVSHDGSMVDWYILPIPLPEKSTKWSCHCVCCCCCCCCCFFWWMIYSEVNLEVRVHFGHVKKGTSPSRLVFWVWNLNHPKLGTISLWLPGVSCFFKHVFFLLGFLCCFLFSLAVGGEWTNEQWTKPWLFGVYRGLYYPVMWGL